MVEGDLYNICERIREIDPSLSIIMLVDDASNCQYAVMEKCSDGVERLVSKHQVLDQRILNKMLELKHIPFEERFAAIERQIDIEEEERREAESEEFYEKMGGPMYTELARTGFIDRNTSYPKIKGRL